MTKNANTSKATLWDEDDTCPQCGDCIGPIWWLECCGLVMCDDCRDKHDVKYHFNLTQE
jgi:hypothetical protein